MSAETGSDAIMACAAATRLTARWLASSPSSGCVNGRFLCISPRNGGVCKAAVWQANRRGIVVSFSSFARGNVVTLTRVAGEKSYLTVCAIQSVTSTYPSSECGMFATDTSRWFSIIVFQQSGLHLVR